MQHCMEGKMEKRSSNVKLLERIGEEVGRVLGEGGRTALSANFQSFVSCACVWGDRERAGETVDAVGGRWQHPLK